MGQTKTIAGAKSAVPKAGSKSLVKVTTAAPAKVTTATLAPTTKGIGTAAQARAEELLAEIERRKERIAEDFYDIGVDLRELLEKKLYGAIGYTTFKAMLDARNVMSLSQAHRLIRVARGLPREKALSVGSEKAALLTSYAEASPEADNPAWLLEQGTLPDGKRIADASTREIAAALKKSRAKPRKRPSPEEAAASADARRAQATLRKQGAKGATVVVVRRAPGFWVRVEMPATALSLLLKS